MYNMEHDLVGCLKAMEQYKEEAASFDKYIEENKDLVPLADAIVSLRENFRDDVLSRANVCQLLYHIDSKKTLRSFKYVLDKEEHMNLPSSMESLVHEISYNIEDDGCIDLCRVKIRKKDMWALPGECKYTTAVEYYLSTNVLSSDENERKNYEDKRMLENAKIVSHERRFFGSVGKFIEFLKMLEDEGMYNEVGQLKSGCFDDFFKTLNEYHKMKEAS